MSERARNLIAIGVAAVALGVIVFGLFSGPSAAPSAEDRIATLSASIRCPFCNGESLAESQAGVAADYRELITERVAAGATDEEILDEFAANFGDSFILDTSTSAWSVALWVVPILALLVGGGAIVWLRRQSTSDVRHPITDERPPTTDERPTGVNRRTLVGVAIVGVAVVAIGVFAVKSLSGPSTAGVEGVAGDVATGQGEVDLSKVTNAEMEGLVAANPDVVGMRVALARRYFEAGEFTDALDHYMIVLDQEKHPEALANVGWMTHISGRSDVALGYVEAALQVKPDYLTATWFLGNIQIALGNNEAAAEAFTTIVESDQIPDDVKQTAQQLLDQMEEG
ncbi:MAG: cytochrome c-type biogenesis protein CcmH [Actinomycetota bacterium]